MHAPVRVTIPKDGVIDLNLSTHLALDLQVAIGQAIGRALDDGLDATVYKKIEAVFIDDVGKEIHGHLRIVVTHTK